MRFQAAGSLVLEAYAGELGVDNRNRKLYILDGNGVCLVSPDGETARLDYTENLTFALSTGLTIRLFTSAWGVNFAMAQPSRVTEMTFMV